MKTLPDHVCQLGSWKDLCEAATQVRDAVFVQEQGFTHDEEYDALDADALHLVICDASGVVLATARLLQEPVAEGEPPTGRIGRVAVVQPVRGQGWGRQLLLVLQEQALQRGDQRLVLGAQQVAAPFYAQLGYQRTPHTYDEGGIPHVQMVLDMTRPS